MKSVLAALTGALLSIFALCQNNNVLPQITPKSPNAASLERYGEIPTNLSIGNITASVPLYKIETNGIEIPIILSNNNSGLKPDEIGSWIGHGWDLRVGGLVSLHQRGTYDFDPQTGIFTNSYIQDLDRYFSGQMSNNERIDYYERIIARQEDSEFDWYNFNCGGQSGSFYFNKNQEVITIPKSDVRIVRTNTGFKITDVQGITYYFESIEQSNQHAANSVENSPPFSGTSVWYITKIVAVNGREVRFVYKNYPMQYNRTGTVITYMPPYPAPGSGCPQTSIDQSDTYIYQENLLLDSILFNEGYVQFQHSASGRLDLKKINPAISVPSLTGLSVKTWEGKLIKTYLFGQEYFGTNDKLKLKEVSELNGTVAEKKWIFTYHSENNGSFPSIFSNAKDHWGYYNGASNTNLIPFAYYNSIIPYWNNVVQAQANADRRSNFQAMQQGMLKTIQYPTGGTSNFTYEANQVKINSYKDIMDLSPYLIPPQEGFSQSVPGSTIVDLTNYNPQAITGSFTLSSETVAQVSGFHQNDNTGFYNAFLSITGPQPSADNIYNTTQIACNQANTNCSGQQILILQPGTYTYSLTGASYTENGNLISIGCGLKIIKENVLPYIVGGTRISKILTESAFGTSPAQVRRFVYTDDLSQVVFRNIPFYNNLANVAGSYTSQETGNSVCLDCPAHHKIFDQSIRPFGGNHIEYKKVTEYNDEVGQNGKTEYVFQPSENLLPTNTEPYVNPINTSWRAGMERLRKVYRSDNNTYIEQQSTENNYFVSAPANQINGIKVDYERYCPVFSYNQNRLYRASLSTLVDEKMYLQTQTTIKKETGGTLTQIQSQEANFLNHSQINQRTEVNSMGQQVVEMLTYPKDYNTAIVNSTESKGIKKLKEVNLFFPIEKLTVKTIAGSNYVVAGTLTAFHENTPVPDKVYRLKITEPVLLSAFIKSKIDDNGVFIKDSRYAEVLNFSGYDEVLNTTARKRTNDVPEAFIWDYGKSLPVAQIINASPEDIAYTSFEADGKGGWTFSGNPAAYIAAPSGKKIYNLTTGNISRTINGLQNYIISFWKQGVVNVPGGSLFRTGRTINGWTYVEYSVSSSTTITISGSGNIDELRLFPKNAQMTSYTYEPLVGITSQSDTNGNILYYEYDNLGRLLFVRDMDRNVIKAMEYKYKAGVNE